MKKIKSILILAAVILFANSYAQKTYTVESFDKIIVSPHIEVTIVQGNKESVEILSNSESDDKLNIEVNRGTLRIYLEGAKEFTKNEKKKDYNYRSPIYQGTVVTARIVYNSISALSIRGEENFISEGILKAKDFNLNIYGASNIAFDEVQIDDLDTNLYGETEVVFKKGDVVDHKVVAYGEAFVNAMNITNQVTKVTSYGDAEFKLNVTDRLKVTSYGEPRVSYKGSPEIDRGISFGEARISSVD